MTFQPGDGCASYVGRIGGQQIVDVGDGCSTGNTIHEIGHAVGLYHEQARTDRDETITVHYENIEAGLEPQFNTYVQLGRDGVDLGAYDLGSIMHYDAFEFSGNGQPTITRKDGSTFPSNREKLSSGDIRAVEAMYGRRARLRSGLVADRCLDVHDGDTARGAKVQTWACNGTNAQRWNDHVEVQSDLRWDRCLEVAASGASVRSGTNVQIGTCSGGNEQKWTWTASGELRSFMNSTLCLDVSSSRTDPGTNVQVWTCNGTRAQRWMKPGISF